MQNNLTEIVFILDRSGSMSGRESDTIGGYNNFLQNQKQAEGSALISTVLFDHEMQVLHDRINIDRIAPLTAEDYQPRGCTALLDAVGGAIHHMGNVHKYARSEDRPGKTIFVIITDGYENASKYYTYTKIHKMITRQKEKYGWEFIFLGANIDTEREANRFGIDADCAMSYNNDAEGIKLNYDALSDMVYCMREASPHSFDEIVKEKRKKIDEDFKKRSRRSRR